MLAVTPVAALMFRFDNPDALLTLVMTVGAWMTLRACENGRARWLLGAGAMVGLAFLTKQLQALLVVPAFGFPGGAPGGFPGGAPGGFPGGAPGGSPGGAPGGARGAAGGPGGLLDSSAPGAAVVAALESDASSCTWVAAAVGSQNASGYQPATQLPVMAIGGFNGSDPSPTLAQFQQYVAQGRIHYFNGGGGFGGAGGSSGTSSEIAAWVQSTFTAQTVDGVTVYDLTSSAADPGTTTTT